MSLRWDSQLPNTPSGGGAPCPLAPPPHRKGGGIREEAFFFALRECIKKCWSVTQGQCYGGGRGHAPDIVVWVSNMLRKLYIREPFYTRQSAVSHNIWQPVVRNLVLHFARRGYGVVIQGLLTSETNWTITINDTPHSPYCVPVSPQLHTAVIRLRHGGRGRSALPRDLTERVLRLWLGVDKTASTDDIKKQYKRAAFKLHPDKNQGNEEEAEVAFKELSNAYTTLVDPNERAWYDSHKEQILAGRSTGGGGDNDFEPDQLNLWQYFSSSAFVGFAEGP
eukprot:gene53212-7876_t